VRAEVETSVLTDVGRGSAAEVARLLEDDDRTAVPSDEGCGRQPGEAPADDNHVGTAGGGF
jgi:hypothetical protein